MELLRHRLVPGYNGGTGYGWVREHKHRFTDRNITEQVLRLYSISWCMGILQYSCFSLHYLHLNALARYRCCVRFWCRAEHERGEQVGAAWAS